MSTKSASVDAAPATPSSGGSPSDGAPRVHVTPTKTPVYRVPQGSRKKKDGFIHNRACIERRMRPGKPGTPRYQRYLNQRFLSDLQAQLSDSEDDAGDLVEDVMEKDFIEQEESFFAELFDPSNPSAMKLWEPFLDIDVDEHDRQMAELSSSVPLSTSPLSHMPKHHAVPPRFQEPLQRCVRNAAYYMLLCSLESHVVHYLDLICEGLRNSRAAAAADGDAIAIWDSMMETTFVEQGCENRLGAYVALDANKYPHLCFVLSDSYQRLLCHAVCAYYMLHSESENAADGRRLTAVRLRQTPKLVAATSWMPSYPKQLLAHYVVASTR